MRLAGRRTQTLGGILICFVLLVRSFIREAALIIVAGTHWANRIAANFLFDRQPDVAEAWLFRGRLRGILDQVSKLSTNAAERQLVFFERVGCVDQPLLCRLPLDCARIESISGETSFVTRSAVC